MKLGELITELKKHPKGNPVQYDFCGLCPNGIDSSRGFYGELALGFSEDRIDVVALIELLISAIGNTYSGYKGGQYTMDEDTTVWVDITEIGRLQRLWVFIQQAIAPL